MRLYHRRAGRHKNGNRAHTSNSHGLSQQAKDSTTPTTRIKTQATNNGESGDEIHVEGQQAGNDGDEEEGKEGYSKYSEMIVTKKGSKCPLRGCTKYAKQEWRLVVHWQVCPSSLILKIQQSVYRPKFKFLLFQKIAQKKVFFIITAVVITVPPY